MVCSKLQMRSVLALPPMAMMTLSAPRALLLAVVADDDGVVGDVHELGLAAEIPVVVLEQVEEGVGVDGGVGLGYLIAGQHIDHSDLAAELHKAIGGLEAGDAGADDDYVVADLSGAAVDVVDEDDAASSLQVSHLGKKGMLPMAMMAASKPSASSSSGEASVHMRIVRSPGSWALRMT